MRYGDSDSVVHMTGCRKFIHVCLCVSVCVCSQSAGQTWLSHSQPVTVRTWWCVCVPFGQRRETLRGKVPVAEQHTH